MKLAGRFGPYGGQYVPETLMAALEELEGAWGEVSADPEFMLELRAHHLGEGALQCGAEVLAR